MLRVCAESTRSRSVFERTVGVVLAADGVGIATIARSVTDPYVVAHALQTHQEPPDPTPMTVIGEQVRPTRAVTSCTTTPIDFRMGATTALSAGRTCWQHWMGAVLQDAAGAGVGVAAARIARAEKAMS